ncbi:MAG: transposase [Akkermansiaceae bacterium]|nr:transposase [Akkermansiaceae bacterium]
MAVNRGIYDRGYLRHWDLPGSSQAITFRLADSVPVKVIKEWRRELAALPDEKVRHRELHRRVARYEDSGHGASYLRIPECGKIVCDCLTAGHPSRYRLIEWCVMSNHVHVLCKLDQGESMAEIVGGWKGASAVRINRVVAREGTLWLREYYDRYVRDLDHFNECRAYIRNNPVKAGLCEKPEDWQFSSAGCGWNPDGAPASAGESDRPEETHAG